MSAETVTGFLQTIVDNLVACAAPVGRAGVVWGDSIVWDCCEGGLIAVRMTSLATVDNGGVCSKMIWLGVEAQIVRCAPTPDRNGVPPSVGALSDAAASFMVDAGVIFDCLRALGPIPGTLTVTPVSGGGCAGASGVATYQVLDWCASCPTV